MVNESLSFNQVHMKERLISEYSGKVPQVIIKSAMQYLSAVSKREIYQSINVADETIPARLSMCSSKQQHDCDFKIRFRNNGLIPVKIDQLKFIVFVRNNAQFVRTTKTRVGAMVRIMKSGSKEKLSDLNTTVTILANHRRLDSDSIRIGLNRYGLGRSQELRRSKSSIAVLSHRQVLTIYVRLTEKGLEQITFRREALVRLMLSSPRKARKRRQVAPRQGHSYGQTSQKVLSNGCIMRTYVWNFNDHNLLDVFSKDDPLLTVFTETGVPIGVYEISYCAMSSERSCLETKDEVLHRGNMIETISDKRGFNMMPVRDNPNTIYYLQRYIHSELSEQGVKTGCCFPTQYRDVRLQFSSGHDHQISHASATNCGCFYGIDVSQKHS
ncbi:hypothetical protein ACOME3_008839 [Neoechinorhynchus agilis]